MGKTALMTAVVEKIKSGLVINTAYGKIDLALPFFREYVREYYL